MQRFADELIGDVRTVEVGGVDVIHAAGNRVAQHGARCARVLRWTKYSRSRELHRAIAKATHVKVPELEGAGFIAAGHN